MWSAPRSRIDGSFYCDPDVLYTFSIDRADALGNFDSVADLEVHARLGKNGQQLSGPQRGRRASDGKVDGDGLVAIGEAGTDEGQFDFTAVGEQALRRAIGRLRLETQGLDPQTGWINDLKNDGVGLCHLPGDGV